MGIFLRNGGIEMFLGMVVLTWVMIQCLLEEKKDEKEMKPGKK